jgi:CrcB protein
VTLLVVAVLGAMGAMLRALIGSRLRLPLGTITVNVAAALLLGLLHGVDGLLATGLRIGLLGALSTWSTVAHEVTTVWRAGDRRTAVVAVVANVGLGVAAAWLGLELAS